MKNKSHIRFPIQHMNHYFTVIIYDNIQALKYKNIPIEKLLKNLSYSSLPICNRPLTVY